MKKRILKNSKILVCAALFTMALSMVAFAEGGDATGAIKTYMESTIGTVFNLVAVVFGAIGGFSLITGIYALIHGMNQPGGGGGNDGGTKIGVGIATLALAGICFGFKAPLLNLITSLM